LTAKATEWTEIINAAGGDPSNNFTNSVHSQWQSMLNTSNQYPAEDHNSHVLSQLAQIVSSRALVSSSHSDGMKLQDILENLGAEAAHGAYLFRLGHPIGQGGAARGAIAFVLLEMGLKKLPEGKWQGAQLQNAKALNDASKSYSDELETKSLNFDEAISRQIALCESQLKSLERGVSTQDEAFTKFVANTTDEWEALRATFETQLAIEAPVKYWVDKATEHKASYDRLKNWPMIIGGAGILAIGVLLVGASAAINALLDWFLNMPNISIDPNSTLFTRIAGYKIAALGGISLFAFTMYIWAIRFVMRLMMTEHHLSIDASARSTMANTYLALSKSNTVSDNEKAIVLAALFKPVTDGIVRDDSLPAFSPASILASQLTKP
jgi:hypothetical protein